MEKLQIVNLEGKVVNPLLIEGLQEIDFANATTSKVIGITTIKTPVTKEILDKFPKLEFIAVAFTGYDAVDLQECNARKIKVYNVPDYSSNSVAELTVAFAISLLRQIPFAHNQLRGGEWDFPAGLDLKGKTIGFLGTGLIGTLTARLFHAFGCNIIGFNRSQKAEFKKYGEYHSFDQVLEQADIISLHMPSTPDTRHIISSKQFEKMKKTAYFINTSRGALVDEDALVDALDKNQIAGAAIDVFEKEPLDKNSALLLTKNLILTPHVAYKTKEALHRRAMINSANIKAHLAGKPQNQVNLAN